MGCGSLKGTHSNVTFLPGPESTSHSALCYNRTITMQALKQSSDGRPSSQVQITFPVTEAMLSTSKQLEVEGRQFWVSACVLPGMDPHMTQDKQCQDMCFFDTDGLSLMCGEFDGHGGNGRAVAHFCAKNIVQLYQSSGGKWNAEPSAFLETVTKKVDSDLQLSTNGIDVSGSGS